MTESSIFRTAYDLQASEIGIVHIGYGAFHRSHQAVYVDDYMQASGDLRWGIAAVNLRASESDDFAKVQTSDGYLLKTVAPDGGQEFRIVRSHRAFVDAAIDPAAAYDLLSRPSVMIASMTVTESGYYLKDDWSIDCQSPAIADELNGGPPQTIYGYLARALARRAEVLDAPITLMCCDNIRNNGKVLEQAVLAYLEASGQAELADWVRRKATFPCSMVDRITPRSNAVLKAEIDTVFPQYATSVVQSESFSQWVLEDRFAADAPDLAKVGVEIVPDVEPYEEAKIRILNGGHTALGYLGTLAGHETFDQAMRDPDLRAHFDRYEKDEVLPGLGDAIPFDKTAYLESIAARFENRGIADQLERICTDGFSKMGIFIRPTLASCLSMGITPRAGYDCAAAWVVFARRFRDGKIRNDYRDMFWERLVPMLALGREEELASDPLLWGDLPKTWSAFTPDLVSAIQRMEEKWLA